MQAAKDAVKKFTSKDGHHDTTVHENVAPAVTQETVTRQQENRVQTAIDKEVHQDHYHTSVQPVHHNETLPTQHHHKMGGVEHKTFEHDDHSKNKERLAAEAAQFKDHSKRVDGDHKTTIEPMVAGEHVHHHVHETIQPVVNKQTVEPHVVHSTIPVHEVHHNTAQHHGTSALPAVSMSEFQKQGGTLGGRDERSDHFTGEPKHVGSSLGGSHSTGTHSHNKDSSLDGGSRSGVTGSDSHNGLSGSNTANGLSSSNSQAGYGSTSSTGTTNTSSTTKATLGQKLNPKIDANGDGKAGILS